MKTTMATTTTTTFVYVRFSLSTMHLAFLQI